MASSHLRKVFDPATLRIIAAETERLRVEHGAAIVVVRGLSGTLVASAMSAMFGTPFAVARKSNEVSHGSAVEVVAYSEAGEQKEYQDWIIVDDLIASGTTVKAIREAVDNYAPSTIQGRCVGIVLYHWRGDRPEQDLGGGYSVPVFPIGQTVDP